MKAVLKAFDCADHDPIEAWRPEDSEPVDYWLCCHIGPSEEEGAELFYVQVLSGAAADAAPADGKKITVPEYSWEAVKARIEEIVQSSQAEDWPSLAKKLGEHFNWEFDGYVEFKERA